MTGPRPSGRPWTRAEDNQLLVLLNSGMKAALIAQKMKRTIGAIHSRKNTPSAAANAIVVSFMTVSLLKGDGVVRDTIG